MPSCSYADHIAADPARPDRRHPAKSWAVLLLALPGTAWSVWLAVWASVPVFAATPTAQHAATGEADILSAVPLCLFAAVCSVIVSRGLVAPMLCALVAVSITLLAYTGSSALLRTADRGAWITAWEAPTSGAIVVWAAWVAISGLCRVIARRRARPTPANS